MLSIYEYQEDYHKDMKFNATNYLMVCVNNRPEYFVATGMSHATHSRRGHKLSQK